MVLNLEDLPNFINNICEKQEIDLSQYNKFIDTAFFAIIWAKYLKDKTKIIPPKSNSESFKYLAKIQGSLESDTTIPLRKFSPKTRDAVELFSEEFINIVNISDSNLKKYIKYIISELINNTVDYAQSNTDIVCCAQLFPKKEIMEIAIVDTGIGFKNSLSKKYPTIKDERSALEKAIKKGVSGSLNTIISNGVQKNAGFGLFTISSMIKKFGSRMIMISYNGMLELSKNSENSLFLEKYWPGSIIIISLTPNIVIDLTHFLKEIREEDSSDEDIF
jgi:hypothetical protein